MQSIQREEAQLNEYPSYPHNTFSSGCLNVHSSIAFAVFQAVALQSVSRYNYLLISFQSI